MDALTFKPKLTVDVVEEDKAFLDFLESGRGLCFIPESPGRGDPPALNADFGDFAKWARQNNPEIDIQAPSNVPKIILRNADVWLPLVYLAGDTSVQVFLNMAASYLYEKAKGSLSSDIPRIHLTVVYEDKVAKRSKKFTFSGDSETLGKTIKKFDLNNFFDDTIQD